MHNNKYISCARLTNGIDFEVGNIELCCFRCHEGGGNISVAKVVNGKVDICELEANRENLILENKRGIINKKCAGCFNLEKKSPDKSKSISYIHFNHWTYCNCNCIYCYTKSEKKYKHYFQNYKALPILKELINKYGFSNEGEITFAGGEPVLLDEFDDIIDYLLNIGAKKIIVHTSGVKYSEKLENALKKNVAKIVISHDSGYEDTYIRIKNSDFYYNVWENTVKYTNTQGDNDCVSSKYVILPKINDNKKEVDEWLFKSVKSGIKSIIVDIEHNYYFNNQNNIKSVIKLIKMCEYIKRSSDKYGIKLQYYNAAEYLYRKYKTIIPFIKLILTK